MKHHIDPDIRSWWEDAKKRIIADYVPVHDGPNSKEVCFPICRLDFRVDNKGLFLNGTEVQFKDMPKAFGESIIRDLRAGNNDPQLMLLHTHADNPSLIVANDDGTVLSVIAPDKYHDADLMEKMAESDYLPKKLEDVVLEAFKSRFKNLQIMYESFMKNMLNNFLDDYSLKNSNMLARNLFDTFVDEVDFPDEFAYVFTRFMSPDEVESVKKATLDDVIRFYQYFYELGAVEDIYDIQSSIAMAKDKIDSLLSDENILMGKLDDRLCNLGYALGEVSVEDILRVASWAEKDGAYAPFLGERLDRWCQEKAEHYELDPNEVLSKRKEVGLHFENGDDRKLFVPKYMIRNAKKVLFGNKY